MNIQERIQVAVRSTKPGAALRALVDELTLEGRDKPSIINLLEEFVVEQRTRPDFREADEEPVMEVLDALGGWCHPKAELLQ